VYNSAIDDPMAVNHEADMNALQRIKIRCYIPSLLFSEMWRRFVLGFLHAPEPNPRTGFAKTCLHATSVAFAVVAKDSPIEPSSTLRRC
jgi:hypothetical protein